MKQILDTKTYPLRKLRTLAKFQLGALLYTCSARTCRSWSGFPFHASTLFITYIYSWRWKHNYLKKLGTLYCPLQCLKPGEPTGENCRYGKSMSSSAGCYFFCCCFFSNPGRGNLKRIEKYALACMHTRTHTHTHTQREREGVCLFLSLWRTCFKFSTYPRACHQNSWELKCCFTTKKK